MNAHHAAALASGLVLVMPAAAEPPRPLEPADQTILNIRLSAAVLATFWEQGGRFPEPYPKLVRLDTLGSTLGAELRGELAPRDGWGRALEILIDDGETFSLISFGSDGEPDAPYETEPDALVARPDDDDAEATPPERDIVFTEGGFLKRPRGPVPPDQRVVADLEAIALAISSFEHRHESPPGPTGGFEVIDRLARELPPFIAGKLPRVDPWGHPYLVWTSDTSSLVVSAGPDGVLDRDYSDFDGIYEDFDPQQTPTGKNYDVVCVDGTAFRPALD